ILSETPVSMAKSTLRRPEPANENQTVEMPRRLANAKYRQREYLTPTEVERLMKAASKNRHGHRDSAMILVCYRHGLRVSELVSLEWSQVDFNAANLHVRRIKGSTDAVHPVRETNYAPCGASTASRTKSRPSSSSASVAHRSARRASCGRCSVLERPPNS